MTEEALKERTIKIKKEIEMLKEDISTLQEIVAYLESNVNKATIKNYKDIDNGLTKLTEKLKVVTTL